MIIVIFAVIVSFLIIFVKSNFKSECVAVPVEYKIFQYDINLDT